MLLGKAAVRGVVVINLLCLFSFLKKKNYKKYSCSFEANEIKFEQQLRMTYTDDENSQTKKLNRHKK